MRTLTILLGFLICSAALIPIDVTNAASVGVEIAVGDRPYYTHGPFYVENGVRWEWIPGHWAVRHHKRVWVHGHYARR